MSHLDYRNIREQLRYPWPRQAKLNIDTEEDNVVPYYETSSRSNSSSVAVQNCMKSEKAAAGFIMSKGYDYRIQCEGLEHKQVDPVRKHVQHKRLRNVFAVSKRLVQVKAMCE